MLETDNKMSNRHRGTSPYGDESIIDDDYSDDFDDDATDAGNRRYKTRSPLNRTGNNQFYASMYIEIQ